MNVNALTDLIYTVIEDLFQRSLWQFIHKHIYILFICMVLSCVFFLMLHLETTLGPWLAGKITDYLQSDQRW